MYLCYLKENRTELDVVETQRRDCHEGPSSTHAAAYAHVARCLRPGRLGCCLVAHPAPALLQTNKRTHIKHTRAATNLCHDHRTRIIITTMPFSILQHWVQTDWVEAPNRLRSHVRRAHDSMHITDRRVTRCPSSLGARKAPAH